MKYLRKFNTEAEYNAAEKSPVKAYVSLVGSGIKYDQKIAEGAYIQHIDGKLYDESGWTNGGFSNDEANGVAVITSKASFVIAKTGFDRIAWSSNDTTKLDGILTTSNSTTALTDFEGYNNTQQMLATDTSGAGHSCANYSFPNGDKGYLPALGELNEAYQKKSEIDALMALIGGTNLVTIGHWSSTQHSKYYAWALNWSDGAVTYGSKDSTSLYARAFSVL